MYIFNGFRYKSVMKMSYGLNALIYTWRKWIFGKHTGEAPKAVSYKEMELRLERNGLNLKETRLWLPKDANFPVKHFGYPTNYLFIAEKK